MEDLDMAKLIPLAVGLLAFAILMIVSMWKVFTKAGEPGWYCIVPILNTITLLKIGGKPWYYIFLALIPGVGGLILAIVLATGVANAFGKGGGFAAGLIFLSPIFYPILAFGSSKYQGVQQPGMQGYAYPPGGYPPGYPPQGAPMPGYAPGYPPPQGNPPPGGGYGGPPPGYGGPPPGGGYPPR